MTYVTPPPINKYTVSVVPDTNIYADNDLVGGKLTMLLPKSGIIETVVLLDQANQSAALDLVLFSADPTGTTFTNNASLDINDTDALKIIGVLRFAASDYGSFADNAVATLRGCGFAYVSEGPLYGALLSNGATPTYVATTDLLLTIYVIPDA